MLGNRSTGSGEDFWRVFTIYGRGNHFGHMTQMPWTNFCSPLPIEAPHKIWLWLVKRLRRRRCLSIVNNAGRQRRQTPTTPDAGASVYYKLTYKPLAKNKVHPISGTWGRLNYIVMLTWWSTSYNQNFCGNLLGLTPVPTIRYFKSGINEDTVPSGVSGSLHLTILHYELTVKRQPSTISFL